MNEAFTNLPDFYTRQEHDDLFAACEKMPFKMRENARNKQYMIRHQAVSFTERLSARAAYVGECFSLTKRRTQESKELFSTWQILEY